MLVETKCDLAGDGHRRRQVGSSEGENGFLFYEASAAHADNVRETFQALFAECLRADSPALRSPAPLVQDLRSEDDFVTTQVMPKLYDDEVSVTTEGGMQCVIADKRGFAGDVIVDSSGSSLRLLVNGDSTFFWFEFENDRSELSVWGWVRLWRANVHDVGGMGSCCAVLAPRKSRPST